jgi:ribosomal protein L11 methyltransferase
MDANHSTELIISCSEQAIRELLVAELFNEGATGVEEKEEEIVAYFDASASLEEARQLISGHGLHYRENRLEARNWNHSWESNFQPVIVEDLVAIRADFHTPVPSVRQELIITPKMSFGTGHHATTYLMILAMMELDMKGCSVLDFGTGTGVLAILAEKQEATGIMAIDNDEWSISNAEENLSKNDCRRVVLKKADDLLGLKDPYDLILANINRHVILDNLASLKRLLKKQGILLVSGLLKQDLGVIREAFTHQQIQIVNVWERGDWICIKASH